MSLLNNYLSIKKKTVQVFENYDDVHKENKSTLAVFRNDNFGEVKILSYLKKIYKLK